MNVFLTIRQNFESRSTLGMQELNTINRSILEAKVKNGKNPHKLQRPEV